MNINEFFSINDTCIICKNILTKECEVDILIERIFPDDFRVAGSAVYLFNGTRFLKCKRPFGIDKNRIVTNKIFNRLPKTFSANKRLTFRINKTILSSDISPWFLNSFDIKFSRGCHSKGHSYYYESQYMSEGDSASSILLDEEVLSIFSYRIFNTYKNGIPYETVLGTENLNNKEYKLYDLNKLPFIQLDKWDPRSSDAIKAQAEKYNLLK